MSRRQPSIRGCLNVLGIIIPSKESLELFVDCYGDLEKEFSTLKKIYFRKILQEHPDKGGDPNEFRKTRSAFEILREKRTNNDLFFSFLDEEELIKDENGGGSNSNSSSSDEPFDQDDFFRKEAERAAKQSGDDNVPSYDYYYEAAQETVPGYRVELAKSGRSRCQKCNRDATKKKKKNSKNKNKNTRTTGTGTGGAGGVGAVKKENPTPKPPPPKEDPSPSPPTAASQEQEQLTSTAIVVVVPAGGGRQTRAMTRAACRTSTAVTLKNLPPTTTPATTTTTTTTVTAKKATKKTTAPKTKKKKATSVLAVADADADAAITKYEDTTLIPKDGIRIGSLNEFSGSYGRWHHLPCWRVPYRIWAGLTDPNNKEQVWLDLLSMDEILLTNVSSLVAPSNKSDRNNAIKNGGNDDDDEEEVNSNKELFIAHVMDRNNWARKTKSSKPPPDLEQLRKEQDEKMNMKLAVGTTSSEKKRSTPDDDDDDDDGKPAAATSKGGSKKQKKPKKSTKGSNDSTTTTTASTTAIVAVAAAASAVVKAPTIKKAFKIPRPGKDGAADSNLYEGKRFVLTGVFPEIGGGIGLDQGKAKVKALVESFGGRVTSAVSGVTDFLIVGRNPGASKVSKAISKDIPRIDLKSLGENIYNTIPSLEQAPTPVITSFSAGYESGRLLQF